MQLSKMVNEQVIRELRRRIAAGDFPEVDFETAMQFLLSDGILPTGALPVESFLNLEDWARSRRRLTYTATELKNKTGEILDAVGKGKTVIVERHGRAIAQIIPI